MTYKKYKIKKKIIHSKYIEFELDGNIRFKNANCNSIYFVNKYPFKTYEKDDEVEIDLTKAKYLNTDNYHQEIVRKVSKNHTGRYYDDYDELQQDENQQSLQAQEQIVLLVSAYDKIVVHKIFRNSLEWLEKYIEIVHSNDYPNWKTRKKVNDNNIKRQDANNPNKVKRLLSSSLYGLKTTMEVINGDKQSKRFLYGEVKKEYYEWLGAVGINPNNCSLELKHFLFEINEILEGRGDKLERDIENREWEIDPNSVEYEQAFSKLFSDAQIPLENERKEYENLEGKTQKDIKFSNNFGGNSEWAEQTFKQMAGQHDYRGFNFMPQKNSQTSSQVGSSGSSQRTDYQQRPNSVIIQNVKQSSRDWRIDEVITEYDNWGKATKKENALVHKSAEVGRDGGVIGSFDTQPVYLEQRFNKEEVDEIKRILKVSENNESGRRTVNKIEQNLNEGEINDFVKEWKLEEIITFKGWTEWGVFQKKEIMLVHKSISTEDYKYNWGRIIVNPEKMLRQDEFVDKQKWAEIVKLLTIRQWLVDDIRNNFESRRVFVWKFNERGSRYQEEEIWFFRKRDNQPIYKLKNLSEAEKQAIVYNGLERQDFQKAVSSKTRKDNNNVGIGKIFSILGIITVLIIGGVAVMKRQLSKKLKKKQSNC